MSNQTVISMTLRSRLEQEIDTLEQRITRLNIHEDNFTDWFDAQLFSQDANQPLDYIRELRQNLFSLINATTTSRSQWLSERIAHQLGALHQAVRWAEQGR
ncbi:hypothetical protein CWI76_04195 [Pseudidiomarina marina]|uniref:Uncharacterized protein n=2 Tax=Pseudidiomarina marina TaxID=502366 RepID=A0A432YKU6_9GAMM|nr:hypothetical protein CWI76_04195 [Pseudidiomarina marina]